MSKLTKEHFDKAIAGLVSKKDLERAVRAAMVPLAKSEEIQDLSMLIAAGLRLQEHPLDLVERIKNSGLPF